MIECQFCNRPEFSPEFDQKVEDIDKNIRQNGTPELIVKYEFEGLLHINFIVDYVSFSNEVEKLC